MDGLKSVGGCCQTTIFFPKNELSNDRKLSHIQGIFTEFIMTLNYFYIINFNYFKVSLKICCSDLPLCLKFSVPRAFS